MLNSLDSDSAIHKVLLFSSLILVLLKNGGKGWLWRAAPFAWKSEKTWKTYIYEVHTAERAVAVYVDFYSTKSRWLDADCRLTPGLRSIMRRARSEQWVWIGNATPTNEFNAGCQHTVPNDWRYSEISWAYMPYSRSLKSIIIINDGWLVWWPLSTIIWRMTCAVLRQSNPIANAQYSFVSCMHVYQRLNRLAMSLPIALIRTRTMIYLFTLRLFVNMAAIIVACLFSAVLRIFENLDGTYCMVCLFYAIRTASMLWRKKNDSKWPLLAYCGFWTNSPWTHIIRRGTISFRNWT